MKKAFYSLLFAILFSTTAFAQQKDFKTIGLGVRYYPGSFNKYIQENEGVTATLVTAAWNFTPGFRLETDFGFYSHHIKSEKVKINSKTIGVGIIKAVRQGNHVFLPGLKIDYTWGNTKIDIQNYGEAEEKIERIAIGPFLGYEYLISNTIGIGADIGLKYSHFESKLTDAPLTISYIPVETKSYFTDSSVFLRVYF
ncbi:MAG: outer membrane beta-barrel protein [Bacteroidetes bacterium]|nr:outer membrane beta-barrel protein [Bacteroidota bacterium]